MGIVICKNGHLTRWRYKDARTFAICAICGHEAKKPKYDPVLGRYVWPDTLTVVEIVSFILDNDIQFLDPSSDDLVNYIEDLAREQGLAVERQLIRHAIPIAAATRS